MLSWLGKVLFAAYFVYIGVDLLQNRKDTSKDFAATYKTTFEAREKRFGFKHPEFLAPANIDKNRLALHTLAGVGYFTLGPMVALGYPSAGLFLSLMMAGKIELYERPWKATNAQEFLQYLESFAQDLALLGLALAFWSGSKVASGAEEGSGKKSKKAQKKEAKKAEEAQKQAAQKVKSTPQPQESSKKGKKGKK